MSWERLLSPQRTRQPFLWSSVTVRNLADALLRFYIHAHHGCVIVIAVDVYHKQVSWSRLSMLALGWAHPLVLHIVLSWTSRAMMPVLAVSGSCSKDDVLFSGDYSVFFVVYIYITIYLSWILCSRVTVSLSCLASSELGSLMQGWCGRMSRACRLRCMVFRPLVCGSELLLGTGQSAPHGPWIPVESWNILKSHFKMVLWYAEKGLKSWLVCLIVRKSRAVAHAWLCSRFAKWSIFERRPSTRYAAELNPQEKALEFSLVLPGFCLVHPDAMIWCQWYGSSWFFSSDASERADATGRNDSQGLGYDQKGSCRAGTLGSSRSWMNWTFTLACFDCLCYTKKMLSHGLMPFGLWTHSFVLHLPFTCLSLLHAEILSRCANPATPTGRIRFL